MVCEIVKQARDRVVAGRRRKVITSEGLEGSGGGAGEIGIGEKGKGFLAEGVGRIRDAERGADFIEALGADGGRHDGAAEAEGFEDFDFDAAALEDRRNDDGGLGVGDGEIRKAAQFFDTSRKRIVERGADRAGDEEAGGGQITSNGWPDFGEEPAEAGEIGAVSTTNEERGGRMGDGQRAERGGHGRGDDALVGKVAGENCGFGGLDRDQGIGRSELCEFGGERGMLVEDFDRLALAHVKLAVADIVREHGERYGASGN